VRKDRSVVCKAANTCKSKLPNSMDSLKRLIIAAMFLVMTSEFCIHPCKQRMRSLLDCGDAMVSMMVKRGGEEIKVSWTKALQSAKLQKFKISFGSTEFAAPSVPSRAIRLPAKVCFDQKNGEAFKSDWQGDRL
jgi:hypothetical protein